MTTPTVLDTAHAFPAVVGRPGRAAHRARVQAAIDAKRKAAG